ncbi:beta-galactosidase [Flavimobilis soli]|uniref:Beta-galactosidase n=1 Tax=Flavimobilis soli TaxID=442709 RepID=A0A2A9EFS6_9MICO|nr:beta-galactosidase [Flavimobilis soli]PFG37079.1 beta-galactosidase [Flavimobilis soli]
MSFPRTRGTAALTGGGIVLGCDYNPEQWDRDTWQEDAALMAEAGVDLVAINIFGWSRLEPRPGEYDWTDLDEVLDLLHSHGIRVNLGTGTASPPPWLSTLHPETLPVTADGTRRFPGGRQGYCPSSPVFRELSLRLVEQVATRYGNHPAVALWHVSNELGCHNALCWCDVSADAFRAWLRERYTTIDALNAAWGTSFWSQRYASWDEVGTPRATISFRNPGQTLDFHRFSSDTAREQLRAESAVLRRLSSAPVTTNFMVTAHIRNLDYWTWLDDVDVVANDHYLDHRLADPVSERALAADLTRGLAGGDPWLLMETAPGAVNWQPVNLAHEAGGLTRAALTHVARGADGICFFQWRASRQGSEKFHSAMLPHAGTDSEGWRQILTLSADLDSLEEVVGSRVDADVALVFSWESWWAADGETRPSQATDYLTQVHDAYRALYDEGVSVDVVAPGADLSGYRLVVVPGLYLVRDAHAEALEDYVRRGGHALVTWFSGIVDEDDRVRLGGYPGAFRDLLGVRSDEMRPVSPGQKLHLSDGGAARLWSENVRTTTATAVVTHLDGPAAGGPALTRNTHGDGVAWYLATAPDDATYRGVVRRLVAEAGVARATDVLDGADGARVEVVHRTRGDHRWTFVVNHGAEAVTYRGHGLELLTHEPVDGELTVPAGAVRVVRVAPRRENEEDR